MTEDAIMVGKRPLMVRASWVLGFVGAMLSGGIWVGVTITGIRADVASISGTLAQDRHDGDARDQLQDGKLGDADTRLRALETSSARQSAQYDAMLSSITDIKAAQERTNALLQQLLRTNGETGR